MDGKREECGVVGVYSKLGKSVVPLLYKAMVALQHRGQDAAGFVVYGEERLIERRGMGLVESVFKKEDLELPGTIGVGHTRYPTIGSKFTESDAQPSIYDGIAIAHNGHIANYDELKKEVEKDYKFMSTVDSEPIVYYLHKEKDLESAVKKIMETAEGSFCDVGIYHDKLIGFRDQRAIRPLVWGENEDFFMFASESVALDVNNIEHKGDIHGGELVIVEKEARIRRVQVKESEPHYCMFEYVYFSRPDSTINGRSVREVRSLLGAELAAESPAKADVVIPVPDTSRTAAMAYAKEVGVEYDEGLMKNRYIGRTFIMPTQEKRKEAVKLKLNPVKEVVAGKSVVLIDDSIVRGTTMREIVQLVRDAGASEVHVRITSPPIKAPCFYGVDIPTFKELIAYKDSVEKIKEFIGADSLAYLSLDGLKKVIGIPICDACLTGNYHTDYVKKLAEAAK